MSGVPPFQPFTAMHWGTVLTILAAAAALPLLARWRLPPAHQGRLGRILGVVLLAHEVFKTGLRVLGYGLPLTENLPLHLCSASVLLTALVLLRRTYPAYEVAYFWGLGGSLMALLTPDLRHGFPHPFYLTFFAGHALVLLGVLYATLVYGLRPRPRSLALTVLASLAYVALVGAVNIALGTNYLYLAAKPDRPSILDYLGEWPWYVGGMVATGALVMLSSYAPFFLLDRRRTHRGVPRPRA